MDLGAVAVSLVKVVVVGLVLGAGLPALFALGLRAISPAVPVGDNDGGVARPPLVSLIGGYLCFGIVGLAVLGGIGWIIWS